MKNIKILLCALIAPICFLATCILAAPQAPVYAENIMQTKAYNYTVSSSSTGLMVVGEFADHQPYMVASNANLEDISDLIDRDRLNGQTYADAKIYFQNVSVENNYFVANHGNITISGVLSGYGFSTYGLIYVNGANITFENANLTNNGRSYLVKNDGNGSVKFYGGSYHSSGTLLLCKNASSVEIFGGNFVSTQSSVIDIASETSASLVINQTQSSVATTLMSNGNAATIVAKNTDVKILGGIIQSQYLQNVLLLDNSPLTISNTPQLKSFGTHIKTNSLITAKYFSYSYSGEKLSVEYTGDIVSRQTVLAQYASTELLELKNQGFDLQQDGDDLMISKVSSLQYSDPKNFILSLPVVQQKFFFGESITVANIEETNVANGVLNCFRFLGWSDIPDATTAKYSVFNPTVVFEEEDITLYAVWQALEFVITYSGVDGAVNNNPITYKSDQSTTIQNPSKQFFVFKGWLVNESFVPQQNLVIPQGFYGQLSLEACWEYQQFDIVYHNLPLQDVLNLGLKTSYDIVSDPYEITLDDILCPGFSFFGIYYDENFTAKCDEMIYLSLDDAHKNSQNFKNYNTIGQTINLYVKLLPYSNGNGDGSERNPYQIQTQQQLKALLVGKKVSVQSPIFVKLACDVVYAENLGQNFSGVENFVFDGDGHTISVQNFTTFEGVTSVFPTIKNATIKNVSFEAQTSHLPIESVTNFGGLAGQIQNSTIKNITLNFSADFLAQTLTSASTVKFSALTLEAENSTFDNIQNKSNFSAEILNANYDVNVYGAALVGFKANNCTFVNCQNKGNILLETIQTQKEIFVYLSGLANLGLNSKILNSVNFGDINCQSPNAVGFLCGLGMAFNGGNVVQNAVNIGTISNNQSMSLQTNQFVFAGAGNLEQNSLYSGADFAFGNAQKTVQNLMNGLKGISGYDLNVWFLDSNGLLWQKPGIIVHYDGNGMIKDKYVHYESIQDAQKGFVSYNTTKYYFQGWTDKDGSEFNWENAQGQYLTVHAKYITYDQMIKDQMTFVLMAEVLILALFLFGLWLFDKKKPVRYYLAGEWIDTRRFARTKTVTLPPEFNGKICFLDNDGKKPFINKKMPCHKISLFVFDENKQNELEAYWTEHFARKRLDLEEKIIKKQQKKEIQILAQKKLEVQKEKERKKRARERKKQMAKTGVVKKSSKKKVLKNKNDSKITIIRKEIKIKKPAKKDDNK